MLKWIQNKQKRMATTVEVNSMMNPVFDNNFLNTDANLTFLD